MVHEITIAAVGAATGMVGGGIAGWLVSSRRHESTESIEAPARFDPTTDAQIEAAARAWATAHGMPEASGLVARKVRLGLTLQRRRRERRR